MKFDILYHQPCTEAQVLKVLDGARVILEIGAGLGDWGHLIKTRLDDTYLIGLEPFIPYFDEIKALNIYDELINKKIQEYDLLRDPMPLDAIIWIDGPEHLYKNEALIYIERLKIKAPLVIITTPNGYMAQKEKDYNSLQEHKSHWSQNDFKILGFKIQLIDFWPVPKPFKIPLKIYNSLRGRYNENRMILAIYKN